MNSSKALLVITLGDFNGIGPETVLKSLDKLTDIRQPVLLLGPLSCWEFYAEKLPETGISFNEIYDISEINDDALYVLNPDQEASSGIIPEPGKLTAESGRVSMLSIEKATDLCLSGDASAMVTAPISKEAVNLAGYYIPGHTEYLASRDGNREVAMMLVNQQLRVVPLTTHIPVSDVSSAISSKTILNKLKIIDASLKSDFGIEKPSIAVMGLNPHAGDGGVIGREEIEVISPALKLARQKGINCDGPFPADGFFATGSWKRYDAILSMYHDQGLVPFKIISFNKGVNFTAGLSFVRTSPDHGTAFSIAGQNVAEHGSTTEAITLALRLGRMRAEVADL